MTTPKSIHVAIVGGGIGGAVLGVALSKFEHISFTIYEAHGAFGEIGAGLGFSANSHLAMKLISPAILENYRSRASFNGWPEKKKVWFDFTVGDKSENEGKRIAEPTMPDEMTQTTAHRAHFLEELVKLLPKDCAEFNKRLTSIDQSKEKVVISFTDGTTAEADIVIGCDGIKSACRPFVLENSRPIFTKKVAYRGLLPMKIAEAAVGAEKANNRQMYLGHGGHLLTFPVGNGALMTAVAFHDSQTDTWEGDWVQPLQKESLQRDFVGWGENVTKIMELVQAPDVWAIFEHPQVSTFHKGRICLLGDAAHATSPHYGQGAGMALEDSYVLSNLLGKCTSVDDIPFAFEAYDSVRVPRALKVVSMSLEHGKVLDMQGTGIGDDLEKIAEWLNTSVKWIWNVDLEAHLASAVETFERLQTAKSAV